MGSGWQPDQRILPMVVTIRLSNYCALRAADPRSRLHNTKVFAVLLHISCTPLSLILFIGLRR